MITHEKIEQYCINHTSPEDALTAQLVQETRANRVGAEMLSGRLVGRLLQLLVRLSGAKHVLEVGTYMGYSALMMAQALPEAGQLITLEKSSEACRLAQAYFDQSPDGHKIQIVECNAVEYLKTLKAESFGLIFIDADKGHYLEYLEAAITLISSGGLIVVDNVLWNGEVLSPDNDIASVIDQLNAKVVTDKRLENVLLPVRDGVNVIRKL